MCPEAACSCGAIPRLHDQVARSAGVLRPKYVDDLCSCITLHLQDRAQVVRETLLIRAQLSVRQHQVDSNSEGRGAQFLRNGRCRCLHHAWNTVLLAALGGRCESPVKSLMTLTAEQLHPSDDMFDAVRLVS